MRASTSFWFSSVSGADNFVGDVRGSAVASAEEDALISTLRKRQNGARSKGYTPDFDQTDLLRIVVQTFSRELFK